ncbi:MAG TPA: DUF899 family protein [Caulobacteraceae bacterium]|jgi:predicted dithiol-disulfide oxidoreductase (DUF899 family)|nr:DUF899 family protein [Caulobacteraceae bacterium]
MPRQSLKADAPQRGRHHFRFPNESEAYRAARDALLDEEIALRRQIERVAAQRRALPLGGRVPEDYVFAGELGPVRLSHLFGDHDTLITYNLMFGPRRERPCPACASLISGLAGQAREIGERVSFVVVAKSPIDRILAFARERGWAELRFVSSGGNSFNLDYRGETESGEEWPVFNVFTRQGGHMHQTYGGELMLAGGDPGEEPRAADLMWPLWNLLDLTPGGRGQEWGPDEADASRLKFRGG